MEIKILSGLAKVFPDEICGKELKCRLSCLKNEKLSFQLAIKNDKDEEVTVSSDCKYLTVHKILFVPADLMAGEGRDDYFLRGAKSEPYPEVLIPLKDEPASLKGGEWVSLWCELIPGGNMSVGEHTLNISVGQEKVSIAVEISDAAFCEQKLMCTHWFHSDCLANYYNVEVFSDKYWQIVENFMKTAVDYGTNVMFTPLFTPPLDTEIGGERLTVQLVDVKKTGGDYSFGFDNFRKWVRLAEKCGMKYFEMSHLFTQWGAENAPKIMAETDEGYKRIFGWETDAHGEEYTNFLRKFASALIPVIDELGIREKCIFHVSDEPPKDYIESYKKSSEIIKEIFGDFKCIDALSDFEFVSEGLSKTPVPSISVIDKFAGRVSELWTYYCGGPDFGYFPNRLFAMPSLRVRILGFIMYKYDVKGFLHWGYNFYNTRQSIRTLDPYKESDAGKAFPAGDSFVVYPAADGTAYCSLRLKVFYDAIQDYEALRLLEKKIGREKTIEVLENNIDAPITASTYPHDDDWLLAKRMEINNLLAK